MPVVTVTRLHIRSFWSYPGFVLYAYRSAKQARASGGFATGWLGNSSDRAFWTATVWDSVESMRAFRNGGIHMKAMPKLLRWCDEASYVHWDQTGLTAPDVETAHEHLARDGKLSKVNVPSALQREEKTVGSAKADITQRLTPRV